MNNQPPLPQPELEPTGINFEEYEYYTPEKLELWNGVLGQPGDQTGFHLAVLKNMGLLNAVRQVGAAKWKKALEVYLREQWENKSDDSEVTEVMLNRLNQAMAELEAVIEFLEK